MQLVTKSLSTKHGWKLSNGNKTELKLLKWNINKHHILIVKKQGLRGARGGTKKFRPLLHFGSLRHWLQPRYLNRRYPTIDVIILPPERKLDGEVVFAMKIFSIFICLLFEFIHRCLMFMNLPSTVVLKFALILVEYLLWLEYRSQLQTGIFLVQKLSKK